MGSILFFNKSRRAKEDTEAAGAAPWVLPGDEAARVEEFRRTSALCIDATYERIKPRSHQAR